jgi:hypothetical protein
MLYDSSALQIISIGLTVLCRSSYISSCSSRLENEHRYRAVEVIPLVRQKGI